MKIKETVHFEWYKKAFSVALIVFFVIGSIKVTEAAFSDLWNNTDQMLIFLKRFLKPDFTYFPQLIKPMFKTLSISLVGTTLGTIVALPLAFFATTTVTQNVIVTSIVRFFLNTVRTIPNLLLAAIMVAIFGIGEFTGMLTVAIFTLGMLAQLFYEAIETINRGPIEATAAVGANKIQVIFYAILPQIQHQIVSYFLYAFEINVRASTILGYVGAGGIGVFLNASLGLMQYDRVSLIILMILLIVFVVDCISEHLRRKLS